MLEKIFGAFSSATEPFQGYLGELWSIWQTDAGRAILLARWSWQRLPEALVQQSELLQGQMQSARAQSQIDQQVNLQLGALGIFPGSASGSSFGLGADPGQAMFTMIMGLIRAHRGDPPASQGMPQFAEAVLRGQLDPVDALVSAAPPFARQQLAAAVPMMRMMGMDHLLRLQAVIEAASALPRDRIPALVPDVEPARPGSSERTGSAAVEVARTWFEAVWRQELDTVEALCTTPFYDGDGDGQVIRSRRAVRSRYAREEPASGAICPITGTWEDTVAGVRRSESASMLQRAAAAVALDDHDAVVLITVANPTFARMTAAQLEKIPQSLRSFTSGYLLRREGGAYRVYAYF